MAYVVKNICSRCGKEWEYVPVPGMKELPCYNCVRELSGLKIKTYRVPENWATTKNKLVNLKKKYKNTIKFLLKKEV